MSRIGSMPVELPQGVECSITNSHFMAKGKMGELGLEIDRSVVVKIEDGKVLVSTDDSVPGNRAMWGTTRANINNLVEGVNQGFNKELEINGVGYRAAMKGSNLELQLGFSHPIIYPVPEGIKIACSSPTAVSISGINKQKVGQVAAEIRSFRPPEPYKGKGVKYKDEYILRKEGKKK